jgi:hypothetical protein
MSMMISTLEQLGPMVQMILVALLVVSEFENIYSKLQVLVYLLFDRDLLSMIFKSVAVTFASARNICSFISMTPIVCLITVPAACAI